MSSLRASADDPDPTDEYMDQEHTIGDAYLYPSPLGFCC
jgi:hypothetical protein